MSEVPTYSALTSKKHGVFLQIGTIHEAVIIMQSNILTTRLVLLLSSSFEKGKEQLQSNQNISLR